MYQKTVILSSGDKLVVELDQSWSNLSIFKDGLLVGSIQDKTALKAGQTIVLPDGRAIKVLVTDYSLEVWHEGKELVTGQKNSTIDGFGNAIKSLFAAGLLQIIMGLLLLFSGNLIGVISGIGSAIIGGILIALGVWERQTGSKSPFWIGIVLCAINIIICLVSGVIGGLMLPSILFGFLYQGTKYEQRQPKVILDEDAPLDSGL